MSLDFVVFLDGEGGSKWTNQRAVFSDSVSAMRGDRNGPISVPYFEIHLVYKERAGGGAPLVSYTRYHKHGSYQANRS